MNAIDLLKQDHDVVDALFARVEETPPSRHPPLFKRIKNELDTHAHIEEKMFYPVLIEKGKKDLVDITKEGQEEHAQIKKFLREIARATDKDKREAKLKVLIEDTRHHVKEEENEMFPMVRDQFSREELEKLGERMEAEKKKFQKARRIPPRPPQAKGTLEKVMDKAKEMAAAILPDEANGKKPARSSRTTASARSTASRSSGGAKTAKAKSAKAR